MKKKIAKMKIGKTKNGSNVKFSLGKQFMTPHIVTKKARYFGTTLKLPTEHR